MRTIERATVLKRDYTRIKATPRHSKRSEIFLLFHKQVFVKDSIPRRRCNGKSSKDLSQNLIQETIFQNSSSEKF